MSKYKTFSMTSSYGDDSLFARAAVCTLIVGVATLLVLLLGSVLSAHGRAVPRPAVRGGVVGGGAGVVASEVANASAKTRQPRLYQNTTKAIKSTKAAKAAIPVNRRHNAEIGLASRLLRESVDDSADPCRDLHAHVCSGYDSGELGGRPLQERAADDVADAVEASFRGAVSSSFGLVAKHLSLRKAAAYYRSCMVADPENPANVRALAAFFKHNDLQLSVDDDGGAASPDFLDKTVELLLRYDLRLFFELRVDAFPERGVRFVRVVGNAEFVDWKRKRVAMADTKEHGPLAQDALMSCGVGKYRAQELARRIWYLEDRLLAKEAQTGDEAPDYDDSVEESWKTSLEAHSAGAFMADFELDVGSNAATSFNDMRSREGVSDAGRALYVAWEACRRLVNASTPTPRKASRCVALTSADYGHVVRAPYLFSALTATRLAQVKTMIGGVVRELIASIDGSRWLPRGFREDLKNRVRRVRWMLGYAPRLDQWIGLDRFYRGYPSATGVFAADYLAARQERMRRFLESLHGDDADTRFAFVEQPRTEPTYVASQNRVALPAASMLPPLFEARSLPEVNYGLLGSVLLSVLTRASMDEINIRHVGDDRDAWSQRNVKQFVERLSCKGTSAGITVSAPSVSVGVHALLRAFRKAAAQDGLRRSMSQAQRSSRGRLFFMSRCLLFCADDHSAASQPLHHRCNVMARRSYEFAEAFGCPDWRNRTRDRCDVW